MNSDAKIPHVSVVIPVFNRERQIRAAIESLLGQEFSGLIEIVVVDDGSTDGTLETLGQFGPSVCVVSQSNQGAAVARWAGVCASRAPLVAFLDSDDLAPPNKLSALVSALESHPECQFAYGITTDQNGKVLKNLPESLAVDLGETCVVEQPFEMMLAAGGPLTPGMNLIARREAALNASAGRAFYRAGNDYDFQIRLAQQGMGVFLAAVTCHSELRSTGLSRDFGLPRQFAFSLHSADSCLDHNAVSENVRRIFQRRVARDWFYGLIAASISRDWRLARAVAPIGPRWLHFWKLPWSMSWGTYRYCRYRAAKLAPESWRRVWRRWKGQKSTSFNKEISPDELTAVPSVTRSEGSHFVSKS